MKKPISKKKIAVCMILGLLLLLAAAALRSNLSDRPLAATHELDGPSGVFSGQSGRVYLIDEGKKSVLVLNENHELEFSIAAGDQSFYYASLVAEGPDGSIYIADAQYRGEGTKLAAERIFRYTQQGKSPTLVYEIDYSGQENPPMQYGKISSLQVQDDSLVFALQTEQGVEIRSVSLESGAESSTAYPVQDAIVSDVGYLPKSLAPVIVTRLGEILLLQEDGSSETILSGDKGELPWRLFVTQEQILYTDLNSNQLIAYNMADESFETLIEAEDIIYTAFESQGRIYSTDYMGFYVYADGEVEYVGNPQLANPLLRAVAWFALLVGAALLLVGLWLLLLPLLKKRRSATLQRMMIVVVVSLSVGTLVSYITLSQMVSMQNDEIMEQLGLYVDVMVEATDVEALQSITEISDYRGENFDKVKNTLDSFAAMTYDNGVYYYYTIYTTDGETIYGVMDYEETMTARHPFYAYGEEGYTQAFEGETIESSADVSSYGSWSFVLKPIPQGDEVVAIMEVGVNLDALSAQTRNLVLQIVLTVASTTIVLLMLIIEAIFYMEQVERRSNLRSAHDINRFPIRTIIFLAFFADCMQDAFVSIYANRLYTPLFGIPQSMGAALPISAQVLAVAIFAMLGGTIIRKIGIKKALVIGFTVQILGFITCAAVPSYLGLLLGKVLIGMGMGFIVVSMNSLAASVPDQEEGASTFAAISAGTLAGVTAGVGIGSVVLSFGTYQTVYMVGAAILVIGLIIALRVKGYQDVLTEKVNEKKSISLGKFLANKRVLSFLLLVLTPFLIALAYREYFFPLYASEMNVSEADISRIYMICGLVVIYAGPQLTAKLMEKIGGKWTVVLASVLMCTATLLFAIVPTFGVATVGVVLLSLATSFGYAAQSAYYSASEGVALYGESRAMGVYSLFDNGGQTLGPLLYALAMLGGYRIGLGIIGIVLASLLVLFIVVNARDTKKETSTDVTVQRD